MEPEALEGMTTSMAPWGPDARGTWCDGCVALGHVLLRTTPESCFEVQPLRAPGDTVVLTAVSRLDNRDELCDALGVAGPDRTGTADSTLILKAYEAWGEACPERMLGDWAFALWDARRRQLFLARDHQGAAGLFYYHTQRTFVFASGLAGLLALPEVPRRPSVLAAAELLVPWLGDGQATAYADLWHLPAAHAMVVTADRITRRRFWTVEATSPVRLSSDAAYVEAFQDLYRKAVGCRLRSVRPVGIFLSGGLDSGSVAALAAAELREQGRPPLQAFTSLPAYPTTAVTQPGRCGDEWPWVEAICRHVGHIEAHPRRALDMTPIRGIERLIAVLREPSPITINGYWISDLLDAAKARNVGVLLTGQGGNATVSWSGDRPSLWARLGALPTAGERRTTPRQLIASLCPAWLLYARARRQTPSNAWSAGTALAAAMIRTVSLEMRRHNYDPTGVRQRFRAREARALLLQPGLAMLGATWHTIGSGWNLEARDPTMDKRVVEFCWAIPEAQYARPDRGQRLLIRRAMNDLLPSSVVWSAQRGQQSADILMRLSAEMTELERTLAELEQSVVVRDYLDFSKMRAAVSSLSTTPDASSTADCLSILLRGLSVGIWLRQFDGRPLHGRDAG